ncbi:MAG: hypothetical protein ACQEXJ_04640 [Myxococcota bacterium]
MNRKLPVLFLTSLSLALAACGSDGSSGVVDESPDASGIDDTTGGSEVAGDVAADAEEPAGEPESVETTLAAETTEAGAPVSVTCEALDADGAVVEGVTFEVRVAPTSGVTVEDLSVTLTATGTFTVACAAEDPYGNPVVDDTPAELTVTPGGVVKTVATVEPAVTEAGGSATVTCEAEDAHGNPVPDATPTVLATPPGDVTVDGMSVTSTVAGAYELRCDAASTEEQVPATWTVEPGPPETFALALDPDKPAYAVNDGFQVSGVGEDAYGNTVEGIAVTGLTATPDGQHVVFGEAEDRIRFDAEGVYEVSAASAEHPERKATREVVVDQTGPALEITHPPRGFAAEGAATVAFEGAVSDNLGEVAWLDVNGEEVPLDPEGGTFSVDVPLGYGINFLEARAADPWGNERLATRAVVWSDGWYALDPPAWETDAVGDAILAELGPEAIDDGDHDPEQMDDLATVLEVVMGGMDLGALLPNPLTSFSFLGDWDVIVHDVLVGDPQVTLELIDGGLHLVMVMTDVEMVLTLAGPEVLGEPVSLDAKFTAALVELEMDLMLSMASGELEAEAQDVTVKIEDTSLLFFDDVSETVPFLTDVDAFINAGLDVIEPAVLGVLETALPFIIEDQVASLVGGLADSLAIDTELEIPAFIEGAQPNVLVLSSHATQITSTPQYLRFGLDGLGHAKTPDRPHDVPGSVRYASCAPVGSVPVPPPAPMVGGIHEDFVNQLLFAIWDGGTLSLDLGPEAAASLDLSQYGVDLHNVSLDPRLPLVFNSCSGENRVQIGDLYLDTTLDLLGQPSHVVVWLQGEAIVNVTTSTAESGATVLGFEIQDFDPMVIEVVTNEGVFEGDDAGLVELIGDQMIPMLIEQAAGDSLSFEIPSFDLGDLSEELPAGAELQLDLEAIGRSGAYLTVEGGLK